MDNNIKVGDYVDFLDSQGGGEVISVNNNNAVILTKDGFEEEHHLTKLVKVDYDLNKTLKSTYIPSGFKKVSKKTDKNSIFKSKSKLIWEIDIHIENLVDNYYHLSNYEIVNYQLEKCEEILHKGLQSKIHKLVIIHGKGQGVLRKEVHHLLYSFRLDFKDSDYLKYSGGATDVFFR